MTWLGWRWIFFVNIPVGVLALLLGALIIPEVRTGRRQPLDLPGVLIASASLVAITYALVEGQSCHWGTVWSFISIPLILVAGVLLMVIFVLVQALRQDRPPLLPFALFHDRNFALMSSVSVIISIGLVGMWLPMSIYLQTILGFSPLKAGLTIAPSALASGFTAPFAGRLADRAGKALLVTGFTLYALGLTVIVLAAMPTSQWYDLLPGYLIAGLGVGCTISPMQTIATRNVSPPLAGAASGVMNTARQAGSALGSAICLAVLQNRLAAHESFITAMRAAIAVPVGLLLAAAVACTAIRRGAVRRPAAGGQPASAGGVAFAGDSSAGGSLAGDRLASETSETSGAWAAPRRELAAAEDRPSARASSGGRHVVNGSLAPAPGPGAPPAGRPAPDPWLARPARERQPAQASPVQPAAQASPVQPAAQASPVQPAAQASPVQPAAQASPVQPAAQASPVQPAASSRPWPAEPVRKPWPGRPVPVSRPTRPPSEQRAVRVPSEQSAAHSAGQAPGQGAAHPARPAWPGQRMSGPWPGQPIPEAPPRPPVKEPGRGQPAAESAPPGPAQKPATRSPAQEPSPQGVGAGTAVAQPCHRATKPFSPGRRAGGPGLRPLRPGPLSPRPCLLRPRSVRPRPRPSPSRLPAPPPPRSPCPVPVAPPRDRRRPRTGGSAGCCARTREATNRPGNGC